ncbi:MAG TPA: haloacid dehalogenase type II [Pseudonocardiaceae bacterium]|nr:haloacid dehalogenase type II [Pseudonocardiaceae bacterium]
MVTEFQPAGIRVITCDVFGTTVDWRTGVADQVAAIADGRAELDAGAFTDAWRDRYRPGLLRVNRGERDWAYLDTLHRESLDELLAEFGVADAFDEPARQRLVLTWHRLPAWEDSVDGLARLRRRHITAALSNGGFALLTHLVKSAGLPFDCILSAELAKMYKPAPDVYLTAARLLDVEPAEILMVAAHSWDIVGAREAGLRTAFVHRPTEKGPHRAADGPDDVTSDLSVTSFRGLADALGC